MDCLRNIFLIILRNFVSVLVGVNLPDCDQAGCLGSRMIGGGFGGSAIAIVRKDEAEAFKKNVGKVYRDKIGYEASFYDIEIVDGTRKI